MSTPIRLALISIGTFISTMCSSVAGAMAQSGSVVWPSDAVWLMGGIFGLGHAWGFVLAYLKDPQ